jgi:proliferating cell nuclear antigen
MDFEAMISAKVLKHAITVLRRVNDEAVFKINANGLMCYLVNSGNTQITQITLPSDAFDLFSAGSVRRIGVDLDRVARILKRATAKDRIHITEAEDRWYFTRGIHQKSTKLLDIGQIRKVPTRFELSHTVKVTMSGKEFKEIIVEAEDVGEALVLNASSKDGLLFDAQSKSIDAQSKHVDLDTYNAVLNVERLEFQPSGPREIKAIYTLDYLHDIAADMKAADEVTWQFATDMPCESEYVRDGCEISHILAPRIEST